VAALQDGARAHGADLVDRTPVLAVEAAGDGVVLHTADATVRAGAVVVATDAWTNRLLAPLGRSLPLTVLREQVSWFAVAEPARFAAEQCPVWIWMDDPSWYGFPAMDGTIKAAQDCGGDPVDPDTRTFDPDPDNEARLAGFLADHLDGVGPLQASKTCLYTLTPDRDFVLDRVPGAPAVVVGLGAAHGFKFAAWFGRELAALALGDPARPELAPFRFDRPALTDPDPGRSWLV
jgi:sarcosine oxidase